MKNKTNVSKIFPAILYMFKNYKVLLIIAFVCLIGSVSVELIGSLFMKNLVDDYIMPMLQTNSSDFSRLARALTSLALIFLVGVSVDYIFNRLMVTVSQGTMNKLRIDLFKHMESLPIRYFDLNSYGNIMSIYTNDVENLHYFMSQSVLHILSSTISLISVTISMFFLNVPLTFVSLIVLVMLSFVFIFKFGGLSARYFDKRQSDLGNLNGYIEEMIQGQKVIKVFCHEQESIDSFKDLNEKLRKSATKADMFASILIPINANLGDISYVLCAILGSVLAINNFPGMTIGTLISFLVLCKNLTQPIVNISQQIVSVTMASAGSNRIFKLLEEDQESDSGSVELVHEDNKWLWKIPTEKGIKYKEVNGNINIDDVSFGYDPGNCVLHDIELYAKPGQKIALVGSTGAGKTTIINLMNRFYDINDGNISYDGISINNIKKSSLRRAIGIVLQDTYLFSGTIMDNIRYGKIDATDEECIEAAKFANAHEFISKLPKGYQTLIGNSGINLSQGQKQLISIARVVVANCPILILDEATSSIDTYTEKLIQDSINKLMKDRTAFIIAHRLSTIKDADCIAVIENGEIVEKGTHDQLIANKGRYYNLCIGK